MNNNESQISSQRNIKDIPMGVYNLEGKVCLQFGLERLQFSYKEARILGTNLIASANELKRENIKPKAK